MTDERARAYWNPRDSRQWMSLEKSVRLASFSSTNSLHRRRERTMPRLTKSANALPCRTMIVGHGW
jgi:hypothetical protein